MRTFSMLRKRRPSLGLIHFIWAFTICLILSFSTLFVNITAHLALWICHDDEVGGFFLWLGAVYFGILIAVYLWDEEITYS